MSVFNLKTVRYTIYFLLLITNIVWSYSDPGYSINDEAKMGWYRDAKFGLFIHWGMYSTLGGFWTTNGTMETRFDGDDSDLIEIDGYAEWIMRNVPIPAPEYAKLTNYFSWSNFNAQDYIDLCFASGQKYIVITSKHHEGFAMYNSQVSSYNICDATPYGRSSGRDPLKELADACNATKTNDSPYEIKMGFYYSHDADWYEPGGADFGYTYYPPPTEEQFQDYITNKVLPQVGELLSNYGEIGVLWFDVPTTIKEHQAKAIRDLVLELSPNTIVNSRIGWNYCDYISTGDNGILGTTVDYTYESCATINDTWGYRIGDEGWKTKEWMLERLIKIIATGGNYLLNVGPKPDGTIPAGSVTPLTEMGDWIKDHAEAIYGTDPSPYVKETMVNNKWGYCTTKSNKLYLHITYWPTNNTIEVVAISNTIEDVYYLFDSGQASLPYTTTADADGNNILSITVPASAPDPLNTILVVKCSGTDVIINPFIHQYESASKKMTLKAQNFQVHGGAFHATYDRTIDAIVNWQDQSRSFDSAVWTIDIPQTGLYRAHVRYAVDSVNAGLKIDIKVNDTALNTFTTSSTGSFDTYALRDAGEIILRKGKQELEINPQTLAAPADKKALRLKEVIITFAQPLNESNQINNGSFELGTNDIVYGWTLDNNFLRTNTNPYEGSWSLFNNNAGSSSAKQTVSLEIGRSYNISLSIDASGMSAGELVFDTQDVYDGPGQGQFVITSNSGYQVPSGSFTATNTSVTFRIFTDSAFQGEVYLDNIFLELVPLPSPSSNLALGKNTSQSSTGWSGTPGRAVDGDTNGDFFTGSVSHTDFEIMPWWMVDLGDNHSIGDIYIYNRTDEKPERLSNYYVYLLDSTSNMVWSNYQTNIAEVPTIIDAEGITARFIKIQLLGSNALSLSEVMVYSNMPDSPPDTPAVIEKKTNNENIIVMRSAAKLNTPIPIIIFSETDDVDQNIRLVNMSGYARDELLRTTYTGANYKEAELILNPDNYAIGCYVLKITVDGMQHDRLLVLYE